MTSKKTSDGKKILLGITGGIAAYKSADLVRRLKEQACDVRVVMTTAAQAFITPLTLQAVSGYPVATDLFDPAAEAAMGHIELARWADQVLIAPASADFIARLAHGHTNDLLSTLCLATTAPIILAPAMNQQMWLHPATQYNVSILQQRGVQLLGPATGSQACGETGPGRMLEPVEIVNLLNPQIRSLLKLKDKKIIITAGPTQEAIDPVRYITNRSSGKMGFALAEAAALAGAAVTLITGPVNLTTPFKVERIDVKTALEMQQAVKNTVDGCDIFIGTAAVADYRCENKANQKIKKNHQDKLVIEFIKNPDILAEVARLTPKPLVIGFAAETENIITNAKNKLDNKKLDLIIANQVGENLAFDQDNNQVVVISHDKQEQLPLLSKKLLARELIKLIAKYYETKNSA